MAGASRDWLFHPNAEARPRRDDDPLSDIHWGHLSRSSNFAPSADFKNFAQHGIGFEPPKLRENQAFRSEEHTSELQSLMRISYAVFCLKKKKHTKSIVTIEHNTTKTQDEK